MAILFYLFGWVFFQDSCDLLTFPTIPTSLAEYFDVTMTLVFLGWVLFHTIISVLPIGTLAQGQPLRDGTKLTYRCNGKKRYRAGKSCGSHNRVTLYDHTGQPAKLR